jgi:putative lipoic acid-binding regulatory protein
MKIPANLSPALPPEKPEIQYPCTWVYKVIGEDTVVMMELIITACAPAEVRITNSHTSSGGKYHSLNATLEVESEEMRLEIYELLKNHPAVKIVL